MDTKPIAISGEQLTVGQTRLEQKRASSHILCWLKKSIKLNLELAPI